jgi:hypothetical protein
MLRTIDLIRSHASLQTIWIERLLRRRGVLALLAAVLTKVEVAAQSLHLIVCVIHHQALRILRLPLGV